MKTNSGSIPKGFLCKFFCVIILSCLLTNSYQLYCQNVAITDDDAYTAHQSAMLDVKSTTKGMLVPRVTTVQMNAIGGPATGLLVFNITENSYYFYDGVSWTNFSYGNASGIWSYSSPNIYMTNSGDYLGLGTGSPLHKLHIYQSVPAVDGTDGAFIDIHNSYNATGTMSGIRFANGTSGSPNFAFKGGIFYRDSRNWNRGDMIFANLSSANATSVTAADARMIIKNTGNVEVIQDPNAGINAAIFNVVNSNGDTVFAVYPEGVRIYVDDNGSKASGNRGGFAVGGFSSGKGLSNEYLRVTPDSVRIYIDDDFTKASKGGFAVGGFSQGKGITDDYLFVQRKKSRIYVDGDEGFAVSNIAGGGTVEYLDLTPDNYFVGHESGISNISGLYNSFFGYQAGRSNTYGDNNIFMGYQTGYSNEDGEYNVFVGHRSGTSSVSGNSNTFMGDSCGAGNVSGHYNVFIGYKAGIYSTSHNNTCIGAGAGKFNQAMNNTFIGNSSGVMNTSGAGNTCLGTLSGVYNDSGNENVYIGYQTGFSNSSGSNNVFLGRRSGYYATGSGNVFIGYYAGEDETGSNLLFIENSDSPTPLIYGEFDNDRVGINDAAPSANLHIKQVGAGEEGFAIENDTDTDVWAWEVGANDLNLYFNGTFVGYWDDATGNYTATSDKRLKKDIEVYDASVLSKVLNLELVSYRLLHADKNSRKTIGFLAQDVQKYLPEFVRQREDGFLALNYDDFGVISIKAIKEQQIIIEELKNENQELKNIIQGIEERMKSIESKLNNHK